MFGLFGVSFVGVWYLSRAFLLRNIARYGVVAWRKPLELLATRRVSCVMRTDYGTL